MRKRESYLSLSSWNSFRFSKGGWHYILNKEYWLGSARGGALGVVPQSSFSTREENKTKGGGGGGGILGPMPTGRFRKGGAGPGKTESFYTIEEVWKGN